MAWFLRLGLIGFVAGAAHAASSSLSLSVSPNPAKFGEQVTFTATVTPAAATGKVTFYDGLTVVGVARLSSGKATLTTKLLAAGSQPVKAYFSGDAISAPSTSAPFPMVVNAVPAEGLKQLEQLPSAVLQFPFIALGDFNGDGNLDVAATGAQPGVTSLAIFLGKGDGNFTPGQTYGGISQATSIVAADFNGDGKTDLAVMDDGASALRIMIGNGDGTFQRVVNYALSAFHLITGDFNGDGIIDIVATEGAHTNGGISVLLGKGDGTFKAPVFLPVANGADAIAVTDVNGDGVADLAVQEGASSFQVYLGKGDGTFVAAGSPVGLNKQISDVATGDFNGDGKADLIVSNGDGVSLLVGNGDGTFGPPNFFSVGRPAYTLGVTDVNGDGHLDVIVGTGYPELLTGTSGSFAVLLCDGMGSLQLAPFHDNLAGPVSFAIGDLNGDGRVDIVEAFSGLVTYLGLAPTDLSVTLSHAGNFLQGQQSAAFSSTVGNLGPAPTAGQVTLSFSLPGALSLVGASGPGWTCSLSNCTRSDSVNAGTSYPPVTLTVSVSRTAPTSLSVTANVSIEGMSDPNPANDSAIDTATVVQYQTIVFGTLPDLVFGAAPFTLTATATSGLPVSYAVSGNCNLQGAIVTLTAAGSCTITASQAGNSLYLPAPSVARRFTIGSVATSVSVSVAPGLATIGAPVTLTATIKPDTAQGHVVFYDGAMLLGSANLVMGIAHLGIRPVGTGIRRISARYIGTPPWPESVSGTVNLTVTSMPAFYFTAMTVAGGSQTNSELAYDLAVRDFNGDGKPDIVAVSNFFIDVLLGDGSGHFSPPIRTNVPSIGLDVARVAPGDFNGDGNLDVAIAAGSQPQDQNVSVWFGRGDGTFKQGPVFAIPGMSVVAADFNGDGFADLAVGHGPAPSISVLLSKGDGTFEAPIEYSVSGDQSSILLATADLNQDGNADLVAVTAVVEANADNRINVLLGRGDGTFLQPAGWVDDRVSVTGVPRSVAVGDLNGDGIPDLVIQNGFSYVPYRCSVTAMVGYGDGTFHPPGHYLCGLTSQVSANGTPGGVVIADFTGDGNADIAAIYSSNQGFLQLFPGNGDGTFQAASVYQYPVTYTSAIAAADFNGDGRVDLAAGTLGSISVLEGIPGAALRIAKTHVGTVTAGQNQAYTITLGDAIGASSTTGAVSVTEGAPLYSNIVSMAGPGWNCSIATCTRSDSLAGGSSFPPITVQMSLEPFSGGNNTLTNGAVLSGGGSPPAEALDTAPVIESGAVGVITGVTTTAATSPPTISPNDWIEIYGVNLVPATTPASGVIWSNAPEFASGRMPTQLNSVSVTVNGKPAYVYFFCSAATSPACFTDQINVLAPLDDLSGLASIVVASNAGNIPPFLVKGNAVSPSFLRFGGSRYVVATHADYSLIGPPTLYPGLSTPAKPGEIVLLWAAGFGLPAGPLTPGSSSQSGRMAETPVCTIGGRVANVSMALVSPGLYQLNVTVPSQTRSGDNPVTCIYAGAVTPDGALLAVK
ncbi:MAG TPA: FG-GAP-like repeat-containing protein [Bryobacteraceae bacterium]|nr:FG-GAP-like repeat-containing protein [Bryobacteraceae bacterium]